MEVCDEERGRDGHCFPIMLCCIFPSSLCAGTSWDVSSKRPSTGSLDCSYRPPSLCALPLDWCLHLRAQHLGLPLGPFLLRCRPSPRTACSFGSWDICRPDPSCVPTGCCRHALGVRPGFCTQTPHWPRTWPSPQLSPCPAHLFGPLRKHLQQNTLGSIPPTLHLYWICFSWFYSLTIIFLAIFFHIDLQVALHWFTIGLTICKRKEKSQFSPCNISYTINFNTAKFPLQSSFQWTLKSSSTAKHMFL